MQSYRTIFDRLDPDNFWTRRFVIYALMTIFYCISRMDGEARFVLFMSGVLGAFPGVSQLLAIAVIALDVDGPVLSAVEVQIRAFLCNLTSRLVAGL